MHAFLWKSNKNLILQPGLLKNLTKLYGKDLNNVDLYLGGMLESQKDPGELFRQIILEQFRRIRDADRFWFENERNGLVIFYYLICMLNVGHSRSSKEGKGQVVIVLSHLQLNTIPTNYNKSRKAQIQPLKILGWLIPNIQIALTQSCCEN